MRSSLCAIVIASQLSAAVAIIPTVTLNNGVQMPLMMMGTGTTMMNSTAAETEVRLALQVGFPAVDAAWSYQNQQGVGRALAEVERSTVFVTTKIGGDFYPYMVDYAYSHSQQQLTENLAQLNLDYLDLVIIHSPPFIQFDDATNCGIMREQWRALEDFYKLGKARAIGVSNYCQSHLACILETANVVPAINQMLVHVGMGTDPRGVISHNDALGIHTMAYQPMGSYDYVNKRSDHSLITGNFTNEIGRQYGKTGAQVALRWLAQHGIAFATSSSSKSHLQEDIDVFDFTLNDAHMQQLDGATTPPAEPNDCLSGSVPIPQLCGPISSTITV